MAKSIMLGNDTYLSMGGTVGWCKEEFPANGNADNYNTSIKQGWYYVGSNASMTNMPASWGYFLVLVWGSIVTQIFLTYNGGTVKIRGCASGTWSSWKTLTPS